MTTRPALQEATPLISIGMSVYNGARFLDEAVCSLLHQTYPHWELIALDDGSTDDSLARLRRYDDPRIRVISDGGNRGLPARLNQAIDLATGPLFARMDSDDVAYPERFERQLAYLRAHPDVDLLAASTLVIDADGEPRGLEKPRGYDHETLAARPWRGFHLNHPTWLGYTAWFRRYRYTEDAWLTEDDELLMRAHRESRYAMLEDILLGYRIVDVSLRKIRIARKSFSKVLWRSAWQYRDPRFLLGIVAQAAKMGFDLVALGTGLKLKLLKHRANPDEVTPEMVAAWRALQAQLAACQAG